MKPSRTRGWFSRSMAALLSAAVFASSFGPGTAALAADVRAGGAAEARVHDGGASAVSPLALVPAVAPSAFAPLTAPALSAAAAASAALPDLGGHARPLAAALPARLVPAAAPALSAAAAASSPLGRVGEWFSRVSGRAAAPAPAAGEEAAPSADESKEHAEVEFRKLTGEAAGSARGSLGAAPVAGADSTRASAPALAPAKRFGGLAAAESRVRAGGKSRAEHLRLLRASVDLRGSGARWTFAYHAPADKRILTFGAEGVASRKLGHVEKPAMIAQDALSAVDIDRDWAALKSARPDFEAVRAEVLPRASGGTVTVFYDARGRSAKAPAAPAAAPAPVATAVPAPATPAHAPAVIPPAPAAPAPAAASEPVVPGKYLHEDFLGFRSVKGVVRDASLGRLPADADTDRIIAQISGQFGFSRDEVLAMGQRFLLTPGSPRAQWLAVYDRLQAVNKERFKRLDSKKYEGWSSFRELANRSYPSGWRGALLRASELHKAFLGFAVRFPYHLFDMFLFGYFRQAIAFEFFHSHEDFFAVTNAKGDDLEKEKDLAKKWLESSMRQQSFRGEGVLGGLRAKTWFRQGERWLVTPLAKPLATFLARRLTLAVMSAVAMGLLGAFAPALPLSFALTSIPLLGPGIVWALNGIPVAVAAVPFVGHFLAPVVAAAIGALAKDLVLGPLLNTAILSTLLTYPQSVRERLAKARDLHPLTPLTFGEWSAAAFGAVLTWSFWRANLKSMFGLATVGAEIAGIMTYAGAIDATIDPGYKAVTGHEFHLFETVGAAVERPQGETVIPFGGAITWGSVLLYKLQDATGFHISGWVMTEALGVKSALGFQTPADAAHATPEGVVHLAQTRDGWKAPFDPDLWKKPMSEVSARISDLAAHAGGLQTEMAAVASHMLAVRARLGDAEAKLALLEGQSKPVTPEEKAEYERLLKELGAKRDQTYVESKLAERRDLQDPKADGATEELRRLKALEARYRAAIPPPPDDKNPDDKNGYWEQLATQEATYKALGQRLQSLIDGGPATATGSGSPLTEADLRQVRDLVDAIESQRQEVQAEMTQRDATQNLLRAANQIRNHALKERRNGQDMLKFHTDFAKLATVMDLALSLNEIAAAQAAIKQMLDLLEAKRAAILKSQQQNQNDQSSAAADQAKVAGWRADAQKTVDNDKSSQKDLVDQEAEAAMAAQRAGDFQAKVKALIAQIDAEDKGRSANALAEYERRLALLPQIQQWRTSGGNPNDPNAFSLKTFQDDVAQVDGYIQKARDGLAKIPTAPIEFAGILVVAVPGPEVSVTNPTQAQMLQILSDRRTYWQQQAASYQRNLDSVNRMMDPGNTATVVDEFGDAHPESLPRWLTQAQTDLGQSHANLQTALAQLDVIAQELNAMTGSSVPMLSGLSLPDLQTAIKTYGDKLKAVKFPAGTDTPAVQQAKMDLILAAQLTPAAAREVIRSSYDQAVVDNINKAMATTLPQARAGLQGVQNMMTAISADVDADVAFVNTGAGGGQALIDRKTALLRDTVLPSLQGARAMLTDTLIPYQQDAVKGAGASPDNDLYKLYDSKRTLMTQTKDLYDKTMPWSLASFGGSPSDVPGSLASIAAWKASLQKHIDGYDDAAGHHAGIAEYQKDMVDRQCQSGCSRTEVLYGETQPYSLPAKIAQYGAEKGSRAAEINAQDATINEILGKIKALSNGKYDLSAYQLPTGIGTDAASAARIQAIVDAQLIQNLGDQLKKVADEAQNQGGTTVTIGAGGGTVPVGTQPSPTLAVNQQIALLALDAAKRLVPSSLQQPDSAPAAYAVARFLYSDAVVAAAQDGLTNQVPKAVTFLTHASASLSAAIAQTDQDVAFVNSNGTTEAPDALYARKVAMFQSLDAFLREGVAFYGLKTSWDQGSFSTIDKINTYYSSLSTIYGKGSTVNNNEITALNTMEKTLQETYDHLDQTKAKVTAWMSQLNPKEQSALKRVSDDVSQLQDKTRAVLEANISWHDLEDQLARSRQIVQAGLTGVDAKQAELSALLSDPKYEGTLPPDLVRRIEALRIGRSAFAMGGARDQAQTLVIKKSEFSSFLDATLGLLTQGAQAIAHQDVAAIKGDLLKNPQGLSAFIPGASVIDFGDNADGFYLVYQSKFSVPNGLETGSWVTLGNVAQWWGNNVSLNGYAFNSPPSAGGQNAPYGDKGVEVQVETLQNRDFVNYLNVDLHRFGFDIPPDNTVGSNIGESRLMVFDDYAMMLMGDRLYVGLAGYGDMAIKDRENHPYYYGGNLKTSLKLTEVMRLNAQQQVLFAKDPRQFLENVNLDFTGYDPTLNRNFAVAARGDNKYFGRTQVGPSFDINRLLNPEGGGDTFTVDLFYAKTTGTDDINQQSGGATVLKGFSIKNDEGKTWLRIDNRLTAEKGTVADKYGDRLSFTLPDSGITVSAEGQLIGDKSTKYAEIVKKTGDNTSISLGYGSQYVGQNDRLTLALNTSFTLAQLWQSVADNSAKTLQGGESLKAFNKEMSDFFGGDPADHSRTVNELNRVFEADIARKLVSQDVGTLRRDIDELRKAGAFLDNTRVRGMVGFTSRAVSNDEAERAVGGGFTVGTYTEMSLTKTQKALISDKSASLYREGLRLQDRLMQLTKDWQSAVVDIAQAQWDVKVAELLRRNAPSEPVRRDAEVRLAKAEAALHQAVLRYNSMTGRDPAADSPFKDLSQKDLEQLMASIRALIASPDRFETILGGLDRDTLEAQLGKDPSNLMDWIPWVEKFSVGIGVQYQDMMANQVLTLGASVRLPIYDPASKRVDHSYQLENDAVEAEIRQVYDARRLTAAAERERALAWAASAQTVAPQTPAAASRLSDSIRAYRNGLIGPEELRASFDAWRWYASAALETRAQASLAAAQQAVDEPMLPKAPLPSGPLRVTSLPEAFAAASANSNGLAELVSRSQAAEEMARAQDHRVQKFWLDLGVGTGLTARGLGFIPSIGITGIPVTPIFGFELKPEELRELQVSQHEQQQQYYEALKTRMETGLAVQFYQNVVAYRAAQTRLALYQNEVLPALQAATGPDAARKLDEARLARDSAYLQMTQARAVLNLLLGRAADAPLTVDMDERQALVALSQILAAHPVVDNERKILDARIGVARAVEGMVDKNLKVDTLQLEPVSLVVRSLGRLIGALTDAPVYNAENAAAARDNTLQAERARESYERQRPDQAARLRVQLAAALSDLRTVAGRTDPESRLKQNELAATVYSLQAGLLALGENPDEGGPRGTGELPASWAEAKNLLASAEQAMSAPAPTGAPVIPDAETKAPRSGAYARYYYAKQTLGHVPLDQHFVEGWIELRLRDPNTPPEVLLALGKLQEDKDERLYRTQLVGASARADVLSAQFENDVRLLRWADRQAAGGKTPESLAGFRADLVKRLEAERQIIVSLLQLKPETTLAQLAALVQEDDSAQAGLPDLAQRLIDGIKAKQVDAIRRTLFENGLPQGLGEPDEIMLQIKADTIAERMSYKGFTPVLAAGVFRGTSVGGAFLEAPDPREIERALENVMSDVLRKQLESDGRLHELSLHLNALMTQVLDGAKELEAERRAIEAAEGELKARAALATGPNDRELLAAQQRLADSWTAFAKTMVDTKSAFITLVAELEALGQGDAGALHPYQPTGTPDKRSVRPGGRDQLLDFWTERMLDPEFAAAQDALLARTGPAVPADARDRIRAAADAYRQALTDGDAVRSNDFTTPEKMALLTRNDVEGKRLVLRAEIARAADALGALDPNLSTAPRDLLAFFKDQAERAAAESGADRGEKRAVARQLRETFWGGSEPPPEAEAAFVRLEDAEKVLDDARQALFADYLADATGDPKNLVMKDLRLDDYLRAQAAFDAEMIKDLESPVFASRIGLARVMAGLHDVRATLERATARAKYGRGMAALDALIMLEQTRLRAARWGGRTPMEIDRIAEALQDLKDTRARWVDGKTELEPVYALTRVVDGKRVWSVDDWWTAKEFEAAKKRGDAPGDGSARQDAEGRWFVTNLKGHPGIRYEVVGGVDVSAAMRAGADKALVDNAFQAQVAAAMDAELPGGEKTAFVGVGEPGQPIDRYSFAAVFGPQGLHAQGRLFFFDAEKGVALHPLTALSRPPESVVAMAYGGDQPLRRDRFPTLQSLRDSDQAGAFKRLMFSPSGAAELAAKAEEYRQVQLRRGWVEVKLNSFGFARDASGRVTQLYRTEDDYQAQTRAFEHAQRDLEQAQAAADAAKAAADRLKAEDARAQAEFVAASARFSGERGPVDGAAMKRAQTAADAELKALPGGDGPERTEFNAAIRELLSAPDRVSAQKSLDKAMKARQKIADLYREARAKAVNAKTALDEATATLEHSKSWRLYLTKDLDLSLDADGKVVAASAEPNRGVGVLSETVPGGAAVARHLSGPLAAAVLDEQGRLLQAYATPSEVDAAAPSWKLMSYGLNGRADARLDGDRVATKVRLSHYEASVGGASLPVLLSERYLIERLDASQSRLGTANHWSIMPYNWGNIVLEIPRGIVQAPIELIGGRDPNSQHYLGRAAMYKTEGGETEHHGFFRTALGWVDVLDLLPDPVTRWYDPSQFPDAVKVDGGTLAPGQILADRSPRDVRADGREYDVKFGQVAMTREVRQAAEDLEAARQRTLARFYGGVEDVTLSAMRGRGHEETAADGSKIWISDYLDSSVRVKSGDVVVGGRTVSVVDQRLANDPLLAADPASDGRDGATVDAAATPNALYVDRVERHTRVMPGAAGYDRQVKAMEGYDARVAERARQTQGDRAGLEAGLEKADKMLKGDLARRDEAASEEQALWNRWHRLAERIGAQKAIEGRIADLRARIADLKAERAWWANYQRMLDEAARGGPVLPGGQGTPGGFWALVLALFGLGALLAAAWHRWRESSSRAPRPA